MPMMMNKLQLLVTLGEGENQLLNCDSDVTSEDGNGCAWLLAVIVSSREPRTSCTNQLQEITLLV